MSYKFSGAALSVLFGTALVFSVYATSIARLSLDELTDTSDMVVAGHVNRSWAAWDGNHKYIWTHYELSVGSTHKGHPPSTVEFAEPGGTMDGVAMAIAGSVSYHSGENVFIFLQRMPNGYLRTTGWGQGRYSVDASGTLHSDSALRGLDVVDTKTAVAATSSARSLEGMSIAQAGARIAAREGVRR
jgi:hypothetical protein